jgi:hypothetical protein
MEALRGFGLPGLGVLVEIENKTESKTLPHIIAVVDVSGSMGPNVAMIMNGALPGALTKMGYDEDAELDVVKFSDSAIRLRIDGKQPSPRRLRNILSRSEGNTKMAGVFSIISTILQSVDSRRPVVIIGISDGQIQDSFETIQSSNDWCSRSFVHSIQVIMIRLQTDRSNNVADTRALACLAKFKTHGENCIFDVSSFDHDADKKIVTILSSNIRTDQTMIVKGDNLRRSPSDIPSKELVLQGKQIALLAQENVKSLVIDGIVIPINLSNDISESCVQFFCEYVQGQVQIDQILGKDVKVVELWFSKMEAALRTHDDKSSTSVPGLRSRVAALKRQTFKQIISHVQGVLQATTDTKLRNLNQQQQADYLRQTTNRSLAKRTHKQLDPSTIDGALRQEAKQLMQELRNLQAIPSEADSSVMSFYSSSNNQELFETLLQEVDDDMLHDTQAILRLFGLMGAAYEAKMIDWVDPYVFSIENLFGGFFLSLNDLREVQNTKTANGPCRLKPPGQDPQANNVITGVIPLRFLNPTLFDFVFQHSQRLLEIHSSINMRCLVSPVRNDLLGERIGVLCHIMKANADLTKPIPAWHQEIFNDVRLQITMLLNSKSNLEEFSQLFIRLREGSASLRSFLAGSNSISCIQKVLIAMMPDQPIADYRGIWNALYEFDCYHRARRFFNNRESREAAIKELFGIDLSVITDLAPVAKMDYIPQETEDEKGPIYRIDQLKSMSAALAQKIFANWPRAQEVVNQLSWIPKDEDFIGFSRFLGDSPVNCRFDTYDKICYVLAAMHCAEEQERLKDGVSLTFQWQDRQSQSEFVLQVVRQFYIDHYVKLSNLEMIRRDNEHLDEAVKFMVGDDCDLETFIQYLNDEIPSRSHPGYNLLQHAIEEQKANDLLLDKLAITITGMNSHNEAKVWQSGNFDAKFMSFASRFPAARWRELCELRGNHCTWVYRESDIPNSHGHCNSNPSYWAQYVYPMLNK